MVAHVDVDIAQVWRDYKEAPSIELRNQLVEKYLPLVKYNADRIWQRLPDGVDLDDLISAGIFGLMDAIEAFDLERGVKFETYCVPRIRGAMLDELRTMDWVPRLVRSKATKMEEARKSLEASLGRPPRPDEMAGRLGVSLEEFHKMVGDATAVSQVYYEDMTMKEIGATLDLSESRVSQMHSSIVARLQAQLAQRRPEFSA
jgi:RNA polymerase sigma factor for flagellar operon FliA